MLITEYGVNSIHNLLTGPLKRIRMYKGLWLEIADGGFKIVLCTLKLFYILCLI